MKNLFSILIGLLTVSVASISARSSAADVHDTSVANIQFHPAPTHQLTAEELGVPEILFQYAQNRVITIKEEHKCKPAVTTVTVTTKEPHPRFPQRNITVTKKVESIKLSYTVSRQGFGAGAINFLLNRTKEGFSYDASRSNDTLFVFDNAFSDYDFIVQMSNGTLLFYDSRATKPKTYSIKATNSATNEVRYITKTFDGGAVSSETKAPLWIANQIVTTHEDLGLWVWVANVIPTPNHLAYGLGHLSMSGTSVSGDYIINGKSWSTFKPFGSLYFPYITSEYPTGKPGQDFCLVWVLYNQSEANGSYSSHGNMGESARVRIAPKTDPRAFQVNAQVTDGPPYYDAGSHTFFYNDDKQALLSFNPTILPAQGKNDDNECIIDLKSGEIYYSRFEALRTAK